MGLEGIDGLSRDAAVKAAGLGGELSPVGQRGAAVSVVHSHRARRSLADLIHFAVVLL